MILPDQDAPGFFLWKTDIFEFSCINGLHYKSHIQETMLDHFFNVIRHPVIQIKLHIWIFFPEFFHISCQYPPSHRFCGSDPDRTADDVFLICKCMLQLIGKTYNGFRLLFKQKSFIRQRNRTLSSDKENCSQFILQLHQLAAERRLCNMKNIRRTRNIAFVCYCQKVF